MNKSNNPLISVVIPCFRQAHFLNESIGSLQAQTFHDWEAIIVNDGSPDDTAVVAAALGNADKRVRYIEKDNGGLSSARNAGIAIAKGDWIQFLDADDLLLPNKFLRHVELIDKCGNNEITYTDFVFCQCDNPSVTIRDQKISNHLRMERPLLDIASRWEHDLSIPIHSPLYPAWLFKNNGVRFDEGLPNHEDWDMWMQVARYVEYIRFIPEELAIYRVCANSMSQDRNRMWAGFNMAISKQASIYSEDSEIKMALKYLSTVCDHIYGRTARGKLKHYLDKGIIKKWPWPIQRAIMRLFAPPRIPRQFC